jgi:hypothetical protein
MIEPLENLPMARPKQIPVFQAEAVQQVTEQMPMPYDRDKADPPFI